MPVRDQMPNLGDTFRLRVEGGHLWMIITTPTGPDHSFVMVNMTTLRGHVEDTSCILRLGDHPCVDHDSVVYYIDAREWWTDGALGYDTLLAKGRIIPREKLGDAVLRRIQDGALTSTFFKRKFRQSVQNSLVQSGGQ